MNIKFFFSFSIGSVSDPNFHAHVCSNQVEAEFMNNRIEPTIQFGQLFWFKPKFAQP